MLPRPRGHEVCCHRAGLATRKCVEAGTSAALKMLQETRDQMRHLDRAHFSVWRNFFAAAITLGVAGTTMAQQANAPHALTAADYQHAEKFLAFNTRPLVYHEVRAKWLPGDRFWYRDAGPDGAEFVLFDAAHGTHQPAFDHAKLAASLSAASGTNYNAGHLPFMTFEFVDDGKAISFSAKGKTWNCNLQTYACAAE